MAFEDKVILDVTCGGRMMWFDKTNPLVLFVDKERREKGCILEQPNFSVEPDLVADFTNLPFEDGKFNLVIFDPPHAVNLSLTSIIGKKYGTLEKDWQKTIRAGFDECYRVTKRGG